LFEVFAEGVNAHDYARNALGQVQSRAQILGEAFAGEGAQVFQEAAVALEVGPQHFRKGQDVRAMRHRKKHVLGDEFGGGLDLALMAGRTEPTAFAGKTKHDGLHVFRPI
jgi:hypothetical protein